MLTDIVPQCKRQEVLNDQERVVEFHQDRLREGRHPVPNMFPGQLRP